MPLFIRNFFFVGLSINSFFCFADIQSINIASPKMIISGVITLEQE